MVTALQLEQQFKTATDHKPILFTYRATGSASLETNRHSYATYGKVFCWCFLL